ncbi:MAG: hypothetical protein ACO3ND_09395, partial [Opitutales bacterium]
MRNVCVLGLGYIGLPTASVLATRGCAVLGVDVSPRVLEAVAAGRAHVEEPDLDVLVRAAVGSGNLRVAAAPAPADVFIIAVPTPFREREGSARAPDLSFVEAAARSLAPVLAPGNLVILESTPPGGTTQSAQQQWAAFDAFIAQDPYLSKHRGEIAERFGGVNPWYSNVDLRILQDFGFGSGQNRQGFQVSLDILNVANLIDSDWG